MAAAARTLSILPISTFASKQPSTTFASSYSSHTPLLSPSASITLRRRRRLLSPSLFGDAVHLSSAFPPPPTSPRWLSAPPALLPPPPLTPSSSRSILLRRHFFDGNYLYQLDQEAGASGGDPKGHQLVAQVDKVVHHMAELEARKLKYPNTGTEALLMGILVEGTSQAAKFLRANGITVFKVREETIKLLGKSYLYFFSPEHPSLTEPSQRALDWAVDEKLNSEITTRHMLLGIWSEKESAGHKILASVGFDDEKASELAKSADEEIVMNYR